MLVFNRFSPQPTDVIDQHKTKRKQLKTNKLKVPILKDPGAKTFRNRLKL